MSKIALFPGSDLSPEVLIHQILENQKEMKRIIVSVTDAGGSTMTFWSKMNTMELAYMTKIIQIDTDHIIKYSGVTSYDSE